MSSIWYYEPFYEFDRFLDDAMSNRLGANKGTVSKRQPSADTDAINTGMTLKPRMDLHESNEKNLVTATFELPGLKKEDVSIDVHNNRMTVSGESQSSSEKEESGYAIKERRYGKFSRTLQLPPGVQEEQIKAHMDHGVLTVQFPKAAGEQAHKKIAVN